MSDTIEATVDLVAMSRIDQQQLAQDLVEQARAEGVELIGAGGLLTGLTKTALEIALQAELSEHLGHTRSTAAGLSRRPRPTRQFPFRRCKLLTWSGATRTRPASSAGAVTGRGCGSCGARRPSAAGHCRISSSPAGPARTSSPTATDRPGRRRGRVRSTGCVVAAVRSEPCRSKLLLHTESSGHRNCGSPLSDRFLDRAARPS